MRFTRLILEAAAAASPADAVSGGDAVSGADILSGSDIVSGSSVLSPSDLVSPSDLGGGVPVGSIITISIIIFALIMIAFEIIRSRYVLSVTRKTVVLDELPEAFDGTRIAVVSDLHQMRFGDFNEELAKHIRREFPDYVFFAGNMGDAKQFNVDAFYDFLDSIGNDIPMIMVPGRDDLRIGGGAVHRNFAKEVEHAGALLLNNTCAELLSDKSKLYVYGFCPPLEPQEGVEAVNWNFAPVGEGDLPAMLGRCPSDAPVLLLAHDPRSFEAYSKWGAQLVLCGYTEGGIVRIPHFGGMMPVDGGKFFPEYAGGEYELDGSKMIVSRGLGSSKGIRFLNSPEITVITLSLPEDRKSAPEAAEEQPAAAEPAVPEQSFIERSKSQFAVINDWFKSESRSLRELLYERSIQIRDFFSLMAGKKRSRFAKAADEKKRQNTYIAPKKPKKQPIPDRSKGVSNRPSIGKAADTDERFDGFFGHDTGSGRNSGGKGSGHNSGKGGKQSASHADHYKRKGQFTVKPSQRIKDENESFGTDYDHTQMRTDLDDERSDLFKRTDSGSDRRKKK